MFSLSFDSEEQLELTHSSDCHKQQSIIRNSPCNTIVQTAKYKNNTNNKDDLSTDIFYDALSQNSLDSKQRNEEESKRQIDSWDEVSIQNLPEYFVRQQNVNTSLTGACGEAKTVCEFNQMCRDELDNLRKLNDSPKNDDFDGGGDRQRAFSDGDEHLREHNHAKISLGKNSTQDSKKPRANTLNTSMSKSKRTAFRYLSVKPNSIDNDVDPKSKANTWPEKVSRNSVKSVNAENSQVFDKFEMSEESHGDVDDNCIYDADDAPNPIEHVPEIIHEKPSIASTVTNGSSNSPDETSRLSFEIGDEALINPVDKQIMELNLTHELTNTGSEDESSKNTDDHSLEANEGVRQKTKQGFKKIFHGIEKAYKNVKNKAEAKHHEKKEAENDTDNDTDDVNINDNIKIKHNSARLNKAPHDFEKLHLVQTLRIPENLQAIIWAMKFSHCGKFLACAGKNQKITVYVLKSYYDHYKTIFNQYNCKIETESSLDSIETYIDPESETKSEDSPSSVFHPTPFIIYSGHEDDILDISWSRDLFLISASSDKTVRLWHIYKQDCLCCFVHKSIISSICFHPKDDRFFVSACLSGQLRLWSIDEKKIVRWNEINRNQSPNCFITAICFCQEGKTIAVGTYDGKCVLFQTDHLKYYSLINAKSRHRNSKNNKITGIEVLHNDENKILITTNDSRIRLYDLRDLSMVCKYKGFSNSIVHIKASLSPDDKYIICGSENKWTYIWKTNHHSSLIAQATGRRDRNPYYERIKAHNNAVTCALFAPHPSLIYDELSSNKRNSILSRSACDGYAICSTAGCEGVIKVFINKVV